MPLSKRLTLLLTFSLLATTFSTSSFAAEKSKQPAIKNVVFLISDDLKASTLGCYGDKHCQTPNIDKLAKEGVVFDRAYCQGTWCAPSRQSFMFSRYKGTSSVNLGQHFINNGRYSARVGKIYHMRVPGDIIDGTNGLDVASSWTERFNSQGMEAHTPGDYACLNLNIFTDAPENRQSTKMPHRMFVTVKYDGDGSDQPDHKTATKVIELLNKHKDKPFFIAAGFVRPHYPMVAPNQYFKPYPFQKMDLPHVPEGDLDDVPAMGKTGTLSITNEIGKYPDNQKRMWAGYYATITFMDDQVGRIVNEVERLGLRDSTAIVFASDHGYHLGEHHFWQKSNMHEEVTRIPLIMSIPGMPTGRSNSLAELMDIFPTVTELAGLEIPASVQGESLVSVLRNHNATVRDGALTVGKNGYALRTDNWAYIRYQDQTEELYDMKNDPKQYTNLAGTDKHQAVKKQLAKQLNAKLKANQLTENVKKKKKQK
ncbi:MAG: iduronate-2-sulfatase [Blastopirellula sp.]|nr:MAG: iduronate-2-sulfatase [Blastopirellula sp.]